MQSLRDERENYAKQQCVKNFTRPSNRFNSDAQADEENEDTLSYIHAFMILYVGIYVNVEYICNICEMMPGFGVIKTK